MRLIVNVHNVLDAELDRIDRKWSPRITVGQLREAIDALSRRFRWIGIDELLSSDAQDVAVLTFDDGYRGVLRHAAPLLRERAIPGAVFVITGTLCDERPLLHFEEIEVAYRISPDRDRVKNLGDAKRALRMLPEAQRQEQQGELLERLGVTSDDCRAAARDDERFAMLTAAELAELRDAGWTIGSHTRTHRALSVLDEGELESEVAGSRDDLRALLHIDRMPFAYPYGNRRHINDLAAEAVMRAGYCCAFTMIDGDDASNDDRMAIRRVDVRDVLERLL